VLSVKGVTACGGVGGAKSQTLTHTGCPTGTGAIFTKYTQLNTDMNSFEAVIYPNPTTTDFRINLNNPVVGNEKIGVKIFDLQGRMVQSLEFTSLNNISFGNNLKSGIYMVHISQGKQTQTKRVVKY
jgi:myo-inositol-hexaphosphate 3-phosphohydrolase